MSILHRAPSTPGRFLVRTRSAACAAIALVATAATSMYAQGRGDVRGTVTGFETETPVVGARVVVATPPRAAITDSHGAFVFRELPSGTYTIVATAIGRAPDSSTVTVTAGQSTTLHIGLRDGSLLLSSVIVSATRTPIEASKVASTVNVLTPEQVRQSPSRESQDMLREIPSVELPRTSSLVGGTAQIVSIRGVDEGRTGVLLDGIPVNDAWGEWIDWGRVPKSMIDHVEVAEGGQSSLYGNGAMGGVISFFSRPMAPGSMDLQLDGGSRNMKHGSFATGLSVSEGLSANVIGDYQDGGGYRLVSSGGGPIDVASNVIQRNGTFRLNYAPSSNWSAFASAHFFGDSRGLGTPIAYDNRDQRDASLGLDYGKFSTGQITLRAWDGRQIEKSLASAVEDPTVTRAAEDPSAFARIPSHDWGASAVWSRGGLLHLESFSLGGDFRHYQGDYNETDYFSAGCPLSPICHDVSQQVSSGGDQILSGAFAQAIAAPTAPLRIELSARVDGWQNNDGHSIATTAPALTYPNQHKTAFSPRLGVRYALTPTLSLHSAVYKAFRAPNLAELYRKQITSVSTTIPNPTLLPETALGRELGLDYQPRDWIQMRGTYYVAEYSDFNSPQVITANRPAECGTAPQCRMRRNVGEERSQGGEAYLALRPIQGLFLSGGVNYDDDRQQSLLPAGTTDAHKPHINRVPSPRQTLRATYNSTLFGDWTVVWRHEGPTTTLQGVSLDPFTVVDADVQRELRAGIRGFVSVENIRNTVYEVNVTAASGGNPALISQGLPRTVRAGIEAYRF
jgi:outer membrane receptor protein involved in Fe transport